MKILPLLFVIVLVIPFVMGDHFETETISKYESETLANVNSPNFEEVDNFLFTVNSSTSNLYIHSSIESASSQSVTLVCRVTVDGTDYGSLRTRSMTAGDRGHLNLVSDNFTLTKGSHNAILECLRSGGGGSVDVFRTDTTIHENSDLIHGNLETAFLSDNYDVGSSSYILFHTLPFTITDHETNNSIYIDYGIAYTNNNATDERLSTIIGIQNYDNCSPIQRDVSSGSIGSVAGKCLIENITDPSINITLYGNGSTANFNVTMHITELILDDNMTYRDDFSGVSYGNTETTVSSLTVLNNFRNNAKLYVEAYINTFSDVSSQNNFYISWSGSTSGSSGFANKSVTSDKKNLVMDELINVSINDNITITLLGDCDAGTCENDGSMIAYFVEGSEIILNQTTDGVVEVLDVTSCPDTVAGVLILALFVAVVLFFLLIALIWKIGIIGMIGSILLLIISLYFIPCMILFGKLMLWFSLFLIAWFVFGMGRE